MSENVEPGGSHPEPVAILREAGRLAGEAVALFRRAVVEVARRRDATHAGLPNAPAPEPVIGSGRLPDGSPIPPIPEPLRDAVANYAVACIGYGRSPSSFESLRTMAAAYDEVCLAAARTPAAEGTSAFARDVLAERRRQVAAEGWSTAHDDDYADGTLSDAAASYLLAQDAKAPVPSSWRWAREWWKPAHRRRNLVKGVALGIAEGERLDRVQARSEAA